MTRRRLLEVIAASLLLPVTERSIAQTAGGAGSGDYPNRPIRMILGGSSGGSTDVITRLVSQRLTDVWHQPIVVENLLGASGAIASQAAARAPANGYTLYACSSSIVLASAVTEKSATSIDYRTAYAPITKMVRQPYVVVVNAALPVTSIRELVNLAKSRPGKLNYGSLGIGSATHLGTELFKQMAGIDMVHIPFKGTNEAETALISGTIDVLFGGALSSMPMVKAGKTRALGVTSITRSKLLPDFPTIAESGYAGFDLDAWFGLIAPAGTPQVVIDKIFADTVPILNSKDVQDRLAVAGSEAAPSANPAAFGAFIAGEVEKWEKFGRESGIHLQ